PWASPEAEREADFKCFAAVASAAACPLLLRSGLSFLATSGAVFYEDRVRDHRRVLHGHSVRSASYGVEAPLAEQFSNDRRLRIGRDNTRASDHRGGFCWIHGGVQPLPQLVVDGYAGSAGNNVLHVSTMLSLRLCRCAAS